MGSSQDRFPYTVSSAYPLSVENFSLRGWVPKNKFNWRSGEMAERKENSQAKQNKNMWEIKQSWGPQRPSKHSEPWSLVCSADTKTPTRWKKLTSCCPQPGRPQAGWEPESWTCRLPITSSPTNQKTVQELHTLHYCPSPTFCLSKHLPESYWEV